MISYISITFFQYNPFETYVFVHKQSYTIRENRSENYGSLPPFLEKAKSPAYLRYYI